MQYHHTTATAVERGTLSLAGLLGVGLLLAGAADPTRPDTKAGAKGAHPPGSPLPPPRPAATSHLASALGPAKQHGTAAQKQGQLRTQATVGQWTTLATGPARPGSHPQVLTGPKRPAGPSRPGPTRLTSASLKPHGGRPLDSSLGQAALAWGQQHLNQYVTLDRTTLQPVIYNNPSQQPGNTYFPSCANFVIAALESVHAKTTVDFGVTDPPGTPPGQVSNVNYQWATKPLLTFSPRTDPVSALAVVQAGDVLQFRNVNSSQGLMQQHTAIVVKNNGGGSFDVLQQNFGSNRSVTTGTIAQLSGDGTMWAYRPEPKPQ